MDGTPTAGTRPNEPITVTRTTFASELYRMILNAAGNPDEKHRDPRTITYDDGNTQATGRLQTLSLDGPATQVQLEFPGVQGGAVWQELHGLAERLQRNFPGAQITITSGTDTNHLYFQV